MEKKLPSARLLHKLFEYKGHTGKLYWKPRPTWMFADGVRFSRDQNCRRWNSRWAGKEAGVTRKGCGQVIVSVFYRKLRAHRVVWAMCYGEWPKQLIDHINHNPTDNRIGNLRDVSHKENLRNCGLSQNNKSGINGVTWDSSRSRWIAQIMIDRKYAHLGRFACIGAAACKRAIADKERGFHRLHGRAA